MLLWEPFRSKKQWTHAELVRAAIDAAQALLADLDTAATDAGAPSTSPYKQGDLSQSLAQMKLVLYGEPETPPNPESALDLVREVLKTELLALLLINLPSFEFECRKDISQVSHPSHTPFPICLTLFFTRHVFRSQVFASLLRKAEGGELIMVNWLAARPEILHGLLSGYQTPKSALNYGSMLRETIRYERLAALLLPSKQSQCFYQLFDFVESPLFDVASDAFQSLKDLLTKHKLLVAMFLESQYDVFFAHYHALISSQNYVTKRQSLKLLGEILLDRSNFAVMTRYISDAENLKMAMILLRDRSSLIQYEAFHVFKILVANPNKGSRVLEMLLKNQQKLIEFISTFQNEKPDEQFNEEKKFLLKEIRNLLVSNRAAGGAVSQPLGMHAPGGDDVGAGGAIQGGGS